MSAIATELEEAHVLDLFAGSGALGIEALSRGAKHATFVESASGAVSVLRKNLADLDVPAENHRVVRGDVFAFVEKVTAPFDVAFADPPYESGDGARLVRCFTERPFARLLCIEHGAREIIDATPVWERRYGDTTLTFLRAPDDET